KVFLSGIHSWLRIGFKDLPFSSARFSSSSFIFFLNCAPDGFCLFIISSTLALTHSARAGVGPLFSPGISGPRPAHFFHGSGNWINEATVQLLLSCSFFINSMVQQIM